MCKENPKLKALAGFGYFVHLITNPAGGRHFRQAPSKSLQKTRSGAMLENNPKHKRGAW